MISSGQGSIVLACHRAPVGALVVPVQILGVIPAKCCANFLAGKRRQSEPETGKLLQPLVTMALLFAAQALDNSWQLQSLAELAGDPYLLAHNLASVFAGSQHAGQLFGGIQRRFSGEVFCVQSRTRVR